MGYGIEQVERMKKALAALPKTSTAPARLKTIDTLRLLRNDIEGLQRKGYRLDAIAAVLGQHGLRISVKTLKNYLSKIRLDPPHEAGKKPLSAPPAAPHHEKASASASATLRPSPPLRPAHPVVATKAPSHKPGSAGGFALYPDTEEL